MFTEHPAFKKPADANAILWRYMYFAEFADILDTRSLFFARSFIDIQCAT
jgi:hypothetical protein